MPLITAGDQGFSPAKVMSQLLEAGVQWLSLDIPLTTIRVVAHSSASVRAARRAFLRFAGSQTKTVRRAHQRRYDLFVSYAHADTMQVNRIIERLRSHQLNVFVDRLSLKPGSAWQAEIFAALDDCRKVVTVYSPAYLASDVCKEEFNIAYARHRRQKNVLVPLYLRKAALPTFMDLIQYIDVRQGSERKIDRAWPQLLESLGGG